MAKHTNQEAYFQRLKNLADVNKPQIKESQIRNLGSLIDYKRAADGVAYGIVKENHSYFLKKAGTKQDPNVADFAYIGGLSNITNYQYRSLSEADKQRNMIFHTINEAIAEKPNINGSKKKTLNEGIASDEIDQAASKLGDLDTATSSEEMPAPAPEGEPEMAAGMSAKPAGETPAEEPAPVGDEVPAEPAPDALGGEPSADGGEELPAEPSADGGEELGGEPSADGEENVAANTDGSVDEPNRELEKAIGKISNKIRKTEMEDAQVKSYVNSFLAAFRDKLRDIDIEDRKEMANKILKVVGNDEIEDLGDSIPQEKPELGPEAGLGDNAGEEEVAEDKCVECGGFGGYAESRGYDSPEKFMECDDEEKANVISGYANAHNDGQNDGDFKTIAIVITPEILEKLKGEYGHDDFANQVEPFANEMNESSEEDKMAQLNELWGGLKSLGQAAMGGIKAGAQKGAQAIGGGIQRGAQAVGNVAKAGAEKVGQAATAVKQQYHAGEVPAEVKKLEGVAANLGKQIEALNARLTKAGQQPVDIKNILKAVSQQVTGKGAGVGSLGLAETANGIDPGNTAVGEPNMLKETDKKVAPGNTVVSEPNMLKEEEEEEPEGIEGLDLDTPETDSPEHEEAETPEEEKAEHEPGGEEFGTEEILEPKSTGGALGFGPDSQSLGVGTIKPSGAGVEISIEPDKSIQISMNEAKKALIKTIAAGVNAYLKEDKNWIQKAVNPEHKGDCTPMTKPSCTPAKKALAKRFKKGIENESVQMNESEQRLRKYVRMRLEEKAGLRKPILTEGKKSPTLVKLDAAIDEQFKLYESVIRKKKK